MTRMIPLDTTAAAAAVQEAAHRRLGPLGRLKTALDLSDLAHKMATIGIRRRHPEYSEEQAIEALARRLYHAER